MKIFINDIEKDIPFELDQITLGQYLEFLKKYKKAIAEDTKTEGLCWFQFFSGFDFLGADDFVQAQVIEQFRTLQHLLTDEKQVPEFITEPIEWRGEFWSFQTFSNDELDPSQHWFNYNSTLTANKILLLDSFRKNPWFSLPALCGVFFRKQNEELKEFVVHESSERYQLMLQLPLHIAMAVKNHLLSAIKPLTA